MIRSADGTARDAKIAELKRLITAGHYETLEKLEDAVDAFLWREENEGRPNAAEDSSDAGDSTDADDQDSNIDVRRGHPK